MELVIVIVVYSFVILGMGVLFLKLTDRLRDRREQRAYERLKREHPERVFGTAEYLARFDHPDFAAIEAHINRPLPLALKKLYSDSATMRSEDVVVIPRTADGPEDGHPILYFFPVDEHAIEDLWPFDDLDATHVHFAADGSGGVYYVELQPDDENDGPVYFYHYDGDIRYKVADSLTEFLSWRSRSPTL